MVFLKNYIRIARTNSRGVRVDATKKNKKVLKLNIGVWQQMNNEDCKVDDMGLGGTSRASRRALFMPKRTLSMLKRMPSTSS